VGTERLPNDRYTRAARQAEKAKGVLTCKECGTTRPLDEFVHIRRSQQAYYGRCRACRNARARARYYSTPEIRAAEIARAQKNQKLRAAQHAQS
jgi:hypothetical protein